MKLKSSKEIAAAARDGAGIDAAVRRAVVKELDMRRKLGFPIVTEESLRAPDHKPLNGTNGKH